MIVSQFIMNMNLASCWNKHFPTLWKRIDHGFSTIMETDKVAILTMTTHEDSKKDDNLIDIPSGKIKKIKRVSQQAAIIYTFIIISSKTKLVQKSCARPLKVFFTWQTSIPLLQGRCTHTKPSFFTAFWMWTRLYLLSQKLQCLTHEEVGKPIANADKGSDITIIQNQFIWLEDVFFY